MSDVESTEQTESNDDLWHVQLPSGQECRMTLDLLDDAFQDGLIHEETLIRQEGTTEWVTLREVAGLDSGAESEPAAPAATANGAQSAVYGQPAPQAPMAQASMSAAAPVSTAAHGAFVAPAPAPQQFIHAPPAEQLTRSTAPVAADIGSDFGADLDLDAMEFRSRKRSPARWIIGVAAVLGGVGFAVMGASSPADTSAPVSAAAVSPVPAPYVPPTPAPPVVEAPKAEPVKEPRGLSDEAKRALAAADKARAAKTPPRREAKGGGGAAAPRRKSDPFHKGGDKFDPLNSSL